MNSKLESLIVFGVMGGLLLPARLLFVEFVSDDWLGSFGVISAISLVIIILAKKKKLGVFGTMLERQIFKFQHGKRGIIIFGESVVMLLILGGMIFAIDQGHSIHAEQKMEYIPDVVDHQTHVLETAKNMTPSDWIFGTIAAPVGFLTAFPQMSAAIASIDHMLDGWLMHFYTVGFVEYLELLGILLYYKISFRRKTADTAKQLTLKTAI
ncbi:MAG: hypothetical protein ACRBBZ_02415 [Nitrosopumilus sp.]